MDSSRVLASAAGPWIVRHFPVRYDRADDMSNRRNYNQARVKSATCRYLALKIRKNRAKLSYSEVIGAVGTPFFWRHTLVLDLLGGRWTMDVQAVRLLGGCLASS